jgi:hypothetical protein
MNHQNYNYSLNIIINPKTHIVNPSKFIHTIQPNFLYPQSYQKFIWAKFLLQKDNLLKFIGEEFLSDLIFYMFKSI